MNHLRQLLDTPSHQWGRVGGEMMDPLDEALCGTLLKNGGELAVCFSLGNVDDLQGLAPIPELCTDLPFEVCWFEAEISGPEGDSIVGALIRKSTRSVLVVVFYKTGGIWSPIHWLSGESWRSQGFRGRGTEIGQDVAITTIRLIRSFQSAMACKNIASRKIDPPEALAKARAKRGKKPLFSYWVLELQGRQDRTAAATGSTHASPRVHLRRGHPRQYAPGQWTWVQATAVGNKGSGMIHKDYRAGRLNQTDSEPKGPQ